MKRIICLLISAIILFVYLFPLNAYATDLHSSDIELRADQLSSNAYKYIENSLKYAKENANEVKPITITLPSGEYKLSSCLHIYSYTNLVLQSDTVLIKDFADGNMLKCGVKEESNNGYDGYTNINVTGGVWDENFNGNSCGMRFAHCSNVKLNKVTIKNNKNSHHIEIAAADNFSIINCSFSGYKRTNSSDGMAVQIDTMHSYTHFPDYYAYDDTPCKNITVKGCSFENVYSGVGPYSGVIGSYFDNITIKNNSFKNIKDKAITAFNYVNSLIYNNKIDGATIGIIFEYYPFEKLTNRFFMPKAGSSSIIINQNSNSKIKGNTINVVKSTGRSNSSGIAVYGGALSASSANSYGLYGGKYFVNNLTVYNNKVNVKSADSSGMLFEYVNSSSISNNTIKALVTSSKTNNGITIKHSQLNTIKNNVINKFDNSVSFKTSSNNNVLKSNTLKNTLRYGVVVDKTSSVKIEFSNTFKKNPSGKILLKKKVFKPKTITVLGLSKKNKTLNWKKVKKVTGYKVFRSAKKNKGYTEIATIVGKRHTSFVDTTAEKGKKYYYKIAVYKAYNGSYIYGAFSDSIKIKY